MRLKAAELRSNGDNANNYANGKQGFSVFQKGFTVKEVKHIMKMIHTEEEEEDLSEYHLHEKKQKMSTKILKINSREAGGQSPLAKKTLDPF